jgi:ABC-type dipeptide/oligopeptide/nickel transport system ATPase subunit
VTPKPLHRLWSLARFEGGLLKRVAFFQVMQSLTYLPFYAGVGYLINDILQNAALSPEQKIKWVGVYALANLALWPVHAWCTVRAFATGQSLIRSATARKAQAHDFITRLDQGYNTLCGERGGRLSGGQRQRIALSRVFLRDPAIVVLDEPTSALDLETEARLQQDLELLCRGRTTFIVAHRLSTLRSVDRVLVFSKGQIIEDGTIPALLAKPAGHFAKLHALQAHGL